MKKIFLLLIPLFICVSSYAQTTDLLINSYSLSTDVGIGGDNISATFNIKNTGDEVTQSIDVSFYYSIDGTLGAEDDNIATYTINNMAAASNTGNLYQNMYIPDKQAGDHNIFMVIDKENLIAETNIDNNWDSKSFTLKLSPPTNLELFLSSVDIRLDWMDNSLFETNYVIQRSEDGANFNEIARVDPGVTSYYDNNPLNGKTNYYRVITFDGTNYSEPSNVAEIFNPEKTEIETAQFYCSANQVPEGLTTIIYTELANNTNIATGNFIISYYLSVDQDFNYVYDYQIKALNINSIESGSNTGLLSTEIEVPGGFGTGQYYLYMVLDTNNDVDEANENDNTPNIPFDIVDPYPIFEPSDLTASIEEGTTNVVLQWTNNDNKNIIFQENFDTDGSFGQTTALSVAGDRVWTYLGHYLTMNGYGSSVLEEDWLFLPPLNLDNHTNEKFSCDLYYKYGDDDSENYFHILYSTDYDGVSDPNNFTWNNLSYNYPSTDQVFESTGEIDLSGISGSSVYIAFKYHYNVNFYRLWDIDNIKITEDVAAGLATKTRIERSETTPDNFSDIGYINYPASSGKDNGASEAKTYYYRCYAQADNGDRSYYSNIVTINIPVLPPLAQEISICYGVENQGFNVDGDNIRWYYSNGDFITNNNFYRPTVSNIGTYTYLTTRTVNGIESAPAEMKYTIKPLPNANAGEDVEICEHEYVLQATLESGETGVWSNSNSVDNPSNPNAMAMGLNPGQQVFYWTVTKDGCEASDFVQITVKNQPDIPELYYKGNLVLICILPNMDYTWYRNNSLITVAKKQYFVVRDLGPGSYKVRVTNDEDCSSESSLVNIGKKEFAKALGEFSLQNISKNELQFHFLSDFIGQIQVELFDLSGKLLQKENFEKSSDFIVQNLTIQNTKTDFLILKLTAGNKTYQQKISVK